MPMTRKGRKIFIVMGSSGKYADWVEWPVVAYLDEQRAMEHCEQAAEWADKNPRPARNPYDVYPPYDHNGHELHAERVGDETWGVISTMLEDGG